MSSKNLLIIDEGLPIKEYIFQALNTLSVNVYLVTVTPGTSRLFRYIAPARIIYSKSIDTDDLIIAIENYSQTHNVMFNGVTTYSELAVFQTSQIAHHLNLLGLVPQVAIRSSWNKYLMREACGAVHIRMPKYIRFRSDVDGLKAYRRFISPTVIKPVNRLDSEGVIKINEIQNEKIFLRKFHEMQKMLHEDKTSNNSYLIEQYISGTMISVDGVVQSKKVYFAGVSTIAMGKEPYFFQETCFIPGNLSEKEERSCKIFAERIVTKLRFDNCAFHCEVKLHKGKLYLIEISARCAGGWLPLQYKAAYGVDLIKTAAQIALGESIDFTPRKPSCFTAFPRVATTSSGRVFTIRGISKCRKNKNVKRYFLFIKKGQRLAALHAPLGAIAFLIISPTKEMCMESVDYVKNNIQIVIIPGIRTIVRTFLTGLLSVFSTHQVS